MEKVKFVDSWGQKRNGVKKICEFCNKEYITRKSRAKIQRFCSSKCGSNLKSKLSTVDCICSWCKKEFKRTTKKLLNSKSGLYFCCRKCKDTAQRIGGIKEIMPPHFGTAKYYSLCLNDRIKFKNHLCSDCGETRYYLLCIHHIDSNRQNNHIDNLETVCYNCHAKRHLDYKDDIWSVNFKSLTPREKLKDL